MWLYVPVRITARLGAQIELVQKQLSKRMLHLQCGRGWGLVDAAVVATHGMRGVIVDMIKRMLGRSVGKRDSLLKIKN